MAKIQFFKAFYCILVFFLKLNDFPANSAISFNFINNLFYFLLFLLLFFVLFLDKCPNESQKARN